MQVTLLYLSQYAHDPYDLPNLLREFSSLLDAQDEFESQQNQTIAPQGAPVVWAWLGKESASVAALARRARDDERVEFLPDEVWMTGKWGVLRRFAPYIPPHKLR